jgi:hypothetical protein
MQRPHHHIQEDYATAAKAAKTLGVVVHSCIQIKDKIHIWLAL